MVGASFELIGEAAVALANVRVVTARHYTVCEKVIKCVFCKAAVAPTTAAPIVTVAAGARVLGGEELG